MQTLCQAPHGRHGLVLPIPSKVVLFLRIVEVEEGVALTKRQQYEVDES